MCIRDRDQPAAACAGQDAVVHLAGEQAVGVRWDEAAKERILSSLSLIHISEPTRPY